jgi:hypothetical protein
MTNPANIFFSRESFISTDFVRDDGLGNKETGRQKGQNKVGKARSERPVLNKTHSNSYY